MVRRRTSPAPGVGTGQSSRRKSEGLGSPTGRDARTMRLPWDMMVPPFFVIASVATCPPKLNERRRKQSTPPQAVKWIASLARNDGLEWRIHQSPSFRGGPQDRTRNLEIPGLVLRTIPE